MVKNWKVRARGQKKFHYANLRENPPFFMSQKHLLGQIRGGRQIWRKSLRGKLTIFRKIWFLAQKCKISKNDFISRFQLKISKYGLRDAVWCIRTHWKCFRWATVALEIFVFSVTPKLAKIENLPKIHQNTLEIFFPPRTPFDTCRRSLFYRKKLKTQNHMVNQGLPGNGTNC